MADIRIATRSSPLARAQAELVAASLADAHPGIGISFVPVATTGDRDRVTAVTSLTEIGAFVRAVQTAVLEGEADIAVHSGKDVPIVGPDGLVAVYPERAAPWDVLCGAALDDLPEGALVGTGSPRRASQLMALRPDVRITGIRGNVGTRLGRIDSGDVHAVVLAEAGLRRLGLAARIDYRFDVHEMVPAAAQAALTVESVVGSEASDLLGAIDHPRTRAAVETERTVLAQSNAGCRSALGVLATSGTDGIGVVGCVDDERGLRRSAVSGPDPFSAATTLCAALGIGSASDVSGSGA